MDTGASSYLANNSGALSSMFNLSHPKFILVGNGNKLPIQGYSNANLPPPHPPFRLNNVVYAPHIITNLTFVRQCTRDNNVPIEFEPLGFSVKDLTTRTVLMRCNNAGDLYPFSNSSLHTPLASLSTISPNIWHSRFGHPDDSVFNFLRINNSISCNKRRGDNFCTTCPLGKHIHLPFQSSFNKTISAFDIVHADLWTSPILSSSGYNYYLLLLDSFTHFTWVYPLKYKT